MRQRQMFVALGQAQRQLMAKPRPRPANREPGPWPRHYWLATLKAPSPAFSLAISLALCLAIVGCGPSGEQNRQAALEQQRQQQLARKRLENCRRDQAPLKALLLAIERQQDQLRQLQSSQYQSKSQPQPPDPALAARFSREDRELDELRYRERLQAWQMAEQRAYGHWLEAQASQKQQLRRESQNLSSQLRRLNPALFKSSSDVQIDPNAVKRASRCEPADFGLSTKDKGDQVGK
jgi:hypothetical protein